MKKHKADPNTSSTKRDQIVSIARNLFAENGYDRTSVREIVDKAGTSMGNLYFHFPNKLDILKVICLDFVHRLRDQITRVNGMNLPPEVGFAVDFKIGYITTLEHPKTSKFWVASRNIPEIYGYSLENKRIRLKTFFRDRITDDEIELIAIAVQGIADGIFEQKRLGRITGDSANLSNAIIDYSLRLIGYSRPEILQTIERMESYILEYPEIVDTYFDI